MRLKTFLGNLAAFTFAIGVSLCISEGVLRASLSSNEDGNLLVRGKPLKPFQFPRATVLKWYESYKMDVMKVPSPVAIKYDPSLGWTNNPNHQPYYNAQGTRNPGKTFDPFPESGVTRIALFGDSFTRDSKVDFEESWGYLLEKYMNEAGFRVEVMNFGVSGYGIDQAYLRWELEGQSFHPHVVILGLYPAEIGRNLEVHHLKNWGLFEGGNAYSKPRFVINSDSELELVNSPTLTPVELLGKAESFGELPYIQHDSLYQAHHDDFEMNFWRVLWTGRLVEANLSSNRFNQMNYYQYDDFYDLNKEAAQLAIRIIKRFGDSVRQREARFIILNMSQEQDIYHLQQGKPLRYSPLLDQLQREWTVVRTEEEIRKHSLEQLFVANDGHHAPLGSQIVAEVISSYLESAKSFYRLASN